MTQELRKERESGTLDGLHRVFRGPLQRFFSARTFDGAVSEDLVQQVFERLVQRGDVGSIENVEGYLFKIAQNVLVDHRRRAASRRSRAHEEFDESLHGGVETSLECVLDQKERLARTMGILQNLPEKTRVIFILRRLEGWKHRDIADRFGISVSAVEKHIERAVMQLVRGTDDRI